MDSVFFKLTNCHGINKFSHEFHFTKKGTKNTNISLIYAPNGTMKTSFAKTLRDIGNGVEPINLITNENPEYEIRITENNQTVKLKKEDVKERIFVIESIKEDFSFQNTAPLISNKESRIKYAETFKELLESKKTFLKNIKKITGIPIANKLNKEKELERIIRKDLNITSVNLLSYLSNHVDEIYNNEDINIEEIKYKNLFDKSVLKLLDDNELIENIDSFSKNLDTLLQKSPIFNNSNFTHNNANALYKSIKKNNLFKAGHKIKFKRIKDEVKSLEELEQLFKIQLDRIFDEDLLKEDFEKINNKFSNQATKDFERIIRENKEIIPLLTDLEYLKKVYWYSVFNSQKEELINLINEFKDKKIILDEIRKEAQSEQTVWQKIIDKFNRRFNIPYTLQLENKEDVILNEDVPRIAYYYKDANNNLKELSLEQLKNIYSNGQRRAIYLLDILYKIEMIKETNKTKLLVFDDIADSFDYGNKYAIIEYLNDLSNDDSFRIILMSHNYDFFRIVNARLNCKNSFLATRNEKGRLQLEKNSLEPNNNIFLYIVDSIKKNSVDNSIREVISLIPFIRNLYEYKQDYGNKNKLTNILHYKQEGMDLTLKDLEPIYEEWDICDFSESERAQYNIYDLICEEANDISQEKQKKINIISKLILSMAIRLKAELYMINKLGGFENLDIQGDQTRTLFNNYKNNFDDEHTIELFEEVSMMTPENIHINSFMFEPILDMDDYYLKKLYKDLLNLD